MSCRGFVFAAYDPAPKRFDSFPPDWGMLRRSRCFKIFLQTKIYYVTVQTINQNQSFDVAIVARKCEPMTTYYINKSKLVAPGLYVVFCICMLLFSSHQPIGPQPCLEKSCCCCLHIKNCSDLYSVYLLTSVLVQLTRTPSVVTG